MKRVRISVVAMLAVSLVGAQVHHVQYESGTLHWYAQQARAAGKSETVITEGPVGIPPAISSLTHAIATYSILIVEPKEAKTYAENDLSFHTWYRCKLAEMLSQQPPLPIGIDILQVPAELRSHLQEHEVFIPRPGGTLTIDGVKLIMGKTDTYDFQIGRRYLVFVALDSSGTVGVIPLERDGIFTIDGTAHLNTCGNPTHPVASDLRTFYSDSLGQFRQVEFGKLGSPRPRP